MPPRKKRKKTKSREAKPLPASSNDLCILHLPNEIIFYIFSFLDSSTLLIKVGLVCKAWNDLVQNNSLWKSFRYLSFKKNENFLYVTNIIKKCPNLRFLKLTRTGRSFDYDKEPVHPALFKELSNLKHLQSFTLHNFKIYSGCEGPFKAFLKSSTKLTHLELDKCYIRNRIAEQISEAQNLRYLCLSRCYSIRNQTFIKIFKSCKYLQHLNLSQQDALNDNVLSCLFSLHSNTLKSLMLRDISVHHSNFSLIEKCSNLLTLNIDCHFLIDKTLFQIKHLRHLNTLELSYGLRFTSNGLCKFFREGSFSQLKYLDMTCCAGLEDSTLEVLAEKCKELTCLDLAECWRVTDKGIHHVVYKCTKLTLLNLEDLKELKGCFLIDLHEHLKSLKVLNLCFCDGINTYMLKKFVKLNPKYSIKKCTEYRLKPVIYPNLQPTLFISQGMKI